MVLSILSYFDGPYAIQYCSSSTETIHTPYYTTQFIITLISG
ncbi:Uncharacterised protein [Salmonella enterica]|uniref:Uncharacterized protein n=1 Tax=Salmonella enterica TaxID=28901 RepID=A0A379QJB7_SALER|nr:Uncharacterised protein [Salmonella enterica]